MSAAGEIVNKVQASGIITLDLKDLLPSSPLQSIDISQWFWQGLVLKEKEFRGHLEHHDWQQYQGQAICLWSSQDAIIQKWAWMLVASKIEGIADSVIVCRPEDHVAKLIETAVLSMDTTPYAGARMVIKGCGDIDLPSNVYVAVTRKLMPVVKNIMFGEPCSTVPIWKRKLN